MNNPILDQVMGRRPVYEDVPVPCAVLPRRSYRDRLERQRQRRDSEGQETAQDRENESMDADLRAVLGEAKSQPEEGEEGKPETEVIPQNAEEIDGTEHIVTARMNKVKDVVQEPSHPSGEKEKYPTPYAALTAPDATPEGMSPQDPSKVPGMASPNKFTWTDLEKATPEPPPEAAAPPTGVDMAVNAMDVLLGRDRSARPATNAQEMAAAGQVTTEEAALASMGIQNPVIAEEAAVKAAAALVANPDPTGGSLMPEHKAADPKKVYETARKWM